ncbi:MAG: LPXTG cell wall anchor domain-containing protein, partial [Planctomycetaceae bacterium]|nr:LPXTG cell wall anchor domain-containing protein [Planctomycetaceae bacterium]
AVQSQKGEITLFLDPNKYFIPVQGTLRGDVLLEDGRKIWREETFEVEESKLINDIWMPFQLTIRVRTSIRPDFISVTNIVITEMEQGKVTKKDVTFHFPEGTEVTDAIKGVSYKTDANGKPIESTIQPLYGLDPSHVKLPEPPKRKINIVFIVAGILLIVTALYLQFRKRRNKD